MCITQKNGKYSDTEAVGILLLNTDGDEEGI